MSCVYKRPVELVTQHHAERVAPHLALAGEVEGRVDEAQRVLEVAVEEQTAHVVDIVRVLQNGRQHRTPTQ